MNKSQTAEASLKTKTRILFLAIGFSLVLFVVKFSTGLITRSSSLLASALDSFMDFGVSFLNLLSIRKAADPPDEGHAYGHGKIESLASYTQGIIILLFSVGLVYGSILRFINPESLQAGLALWVVILSAFANLILTYYLEKAEKQTSSLILRVEKTHYLMDLLSYAVIALALILVRLTGWHGWDSLGGLAVAGYVAYLAVDILIQAGGELVDQSLSAKILEEIDQIIGRHDERILSYHDLRSRKVGEKKFLDFHLVISPEQTLQQAHVISETLIAEIKKALGDVDVTIHEDIEDDRRFG